MDILNNSFLNIILKEEVSNELLQIMYGNNSDPYFIENTNAAYILYKNNISFLGISGVNYKQSLVLAYVKNLLDKLFKEPDFWNSMANYLRSQPYKPLPNNIDRVNINSEAEIEFVYKKNWLLEEKFPSYKIQDTQVSQTKTATIPTVMGNLEVDLPRLNRASQITNVSSANQIQKYSYGYTVGLLTSEIFNRTFYKEVFVKVKPPEEEEETEIVNSEEIEEEPLTDEDMTDINSKNVEYYRKKVVLKRIRKSNINTFNRLNNSIMSKELKILTKPDFINKTVQSILAFDFTNIGYKPILSLNSYLT
ncbi:MAG: hypothetical protein HEQ35_06615 [Gloeotrichia echinulata IR180]